MSVIGRSVQIAHILGVLLISSICLYNLSVRSEPAGHAETGKSGSGNSGALTVVDTASDEEDDGVVSVEDSDAEEVIDENLEEFRPTDEWQTVKKGQKIPPGLHVRMDFQTGQKQAKVMEEDSTQKMKQWDGGKNIGIINTEEKRYTRDELKAVLKNFKYKDTSQESEQKKKDEIKDKFRSYEELKKSMQDIKMSVKTEGEIVSELAVEIKKPGLKADHLKTLLVDLEYYLHQVDNAQLFCDLGGMKTMMNMMNNSQAEIREATAHALGAALQSNTKVQVKALDAGVMQELLKLLAVDPAPAVRKKALFALSTLIRQFPFAQKKFLKQGGLSALAQLFMTTKDEKLKIKVITLLTDLLTEYDLNVRQVNQDDKVQEERTQQYKDVDLREQMSSSGWCDLMISLLHSQSEHDNVEKVLHAMSVLVHTCQAEFSPARPKLQSLLSVYHKLSQEEMEEDSVGFFSSIHSMLKQLVDDVYRDDL